LQQVDFRIAAARADNNSAAVAQLQPAATTLTGKIQAKRLPASARRRRNRSRGPKFRPFS